MRHVSSSSSLSLHDALPIYPVARAEVEHARGVLAQELGADFRLPLEASGRSRGRRVQHLDGDGLPQLVVAGRSEEHTSELQSSENLICRLLLENKKNE